MKKKGLKKNDILDLMKSKRRKTIYTTQIPEKRKGNPRFVGVYSDKIFSFNNFVGAYRMNLKEVKNTPDKVTFFDK